MTKGLDTIKFDDREEIYEIIRALESSADGDKDTVNRMIRLLDGILMNW